MLIKKLKLYHIIPVLLFLVSFILGFSIKMPTFDNTLNIDINTIFPNTFLGILTNNLKVILTNLSGSIIFGLSTFVNTLYNGFMIGFEIKGLFFIGANLKFVLITMLPHGIFEIPAMLISAVAGFKIPYEVIQYLRDKKEKPITEEDIKEFLKLALISIVLIIIAAFVEVYITPKIANYLLNK
ncbi:stage II sporulation protein M [Methanothermococcus sp.]|uniref:stage II sporulation protein M n=1 Tax=Methanothermococcus sp. TaxID=2614238 RepID=UPI0025D5FE7B|nr:stage II sporulation protein M [Methanothermococcus sp.]